MSSEVKIPPEFRELLPQFVKKYLPDNVEKFDQQEFIKPCPAYPNGKFGYFEKKRMLTQYDWMFHFYLSPKNEANKVIASLSLSGLDKTGTIRWISIDIDEETQMLSWKKKLQPHLDKLGIEYFIEWGGDEIGHQEFNRCHVLIFLDSVPLEDATNFTRQLFYDVDEFVFSREKHFFKDSNGNPRTDDGFDEIFPINKPKNKIRPPYGYHKKRERRYPCECKGQVLDDVISVLKAIILCKPVTLDFIRSYVKSDVVERLSKNDFKERVSTGLNKKYRFYYEPRKLPLPVDKIPSKLIPVVRNCQTINRLLEDVREKRFIDIPGSTHHDGQLMLRGLTKYVDARFDTTEGEEFYDYLRSEFRFRSDDSHQLDRREHDNNPVRYFPNCETWHNYFGLCDGCPFKITSPRKFIGGQVIRKELLRNIKLSNLYWIRKDSFPKDKERLITYVQTKARKSLLYAYPQGVGKSHSIVRESIVELVNLGLKCLIAVPSTDLAIEYKEDLKSKGINSFVLSSHKSMFNPEKEKRITQDECPFYSDMQELESLGVSNSTIKEQFCSSCLQNSTCPFPRQYVDVQDPIHQVVIIQHAHFSCQEVIYELLNKNFDVIYVDESFIEAIFKFIEIPLSDIIALKDVAEQFNLDWALDLANWLSCKELPQGRLNPDELSLSLVRSHFQSLFLKWQVPDYIRYYNQKRIVNPVSGIEVIHEIPDLPVKIFTDATPPIELIKHLTGITDIDVVGGDVVLDVKAIHPDNEIIQILDFTSSVTKLEDEETFFLILDKIVQEISESDINSKHLITAYKKDHRRIRSYLEENHPSVLSKIEISPISKGINRFSEFDSQYILANILFLGKEYMHQLYKYVQVANYHRQKKNLKPIPNIFPMGLTEKTRIQTTWESVKRIVNDQLLEFPQFQIPVPAKGADEYDENYWFRLIYEFTVGQIQQAIRVRLTADKPRRIVILNNVSLPSVSTTKYITLEQWLGS